jgi:hypothetical protein
MSETTTIMVTMPAHVGDALATLAMLEQRDVQKLVAQVLTEAALPVVAQMRAADLAGEGQREVVMRRLAILYEWRAAVKARGRWSVEKATKVFRQTLRKRGEDVSQRSLYTWDACHRAGVPLTDKRATRHTFSRAEDPFFVLLLRAWRSGRHRTMTGAWLEAVEEAKAAGLKPRSCGASANYLRPLKRAARAAGEAVQADDQQHSEGGVERPSTPL